MMFQSLVTNNYIINQNHAYFVKKSHAYFVQIEKNACYLGAFNKYENAIFNGEQEKKNICVRIG